MRSIKLWLILFSIGLIIIDKYSFVNNVRDSVVVFIQKNTSLFIYRVMNYPRLVFLQTSHQQELATQNAQLKKQVEQYSVLLQQTKNQAQDIKTVSTLNPDGIYNKFNQTVAKAILDVNFLVNNQLLIDAGKSKNIIQGSAVVTGNGIIGQVTNTNTDNSQVTLITNPNFKIYVQQATTKSKMLAQGSGGDSILVRYIDKNDVIKPGDILETTGLDDIYPSNIPVAKVIKVFYENNGFNSALCEPVVNFRQIQYVVVLKK